MALVAERQAETVERPPDTRAAVTVHELTEPDFARWDRFVHDCPDATFCHRAGWSRVLRRAFGYAPRFLYAEQDGRITGVLPLVEVKSRLFGHALVSSAFAVYGGPACSTDEARRALTARALALADALDVDHVEYRSQRAREPGWACKSDLYVTFRLVLGPDPARLLAALPAKRRSIRKAEKLGVTATLDGDITRFYDVFALSVRNLGTPAMPRSWFQAIRDEFGDDVEILTVARGDTLLSSAMLFYFRDDAHCYYVGNTPDARDAAGSDYMWWSAMQRAAARGARSFDMGRSKRGTGSFEFKRRWGVEPTPLHYEYRLRRGDALPDTNPLNPKYRLFIALWKRLPLPIANRLGPLIVRGLG
ncbi:MAG: FemAB family XrtA/PEP-CTERM system-associated protein [Pseudomonadota bacterium]